MSTSKESNTSEIDKKKNTNPDNTVTYENTYNYGSFLFRQFITLGVVILVGTSIVYSSKAYQGNIIPVDTHYFPYTNIKNPKVKESDVQTNSINIFKTNDNKIYSTHIEFPVDENNKTINSGLLGYFRKIKDKNVYSLYIFTVLQDILTTNLLFNGTLYTFLSSVFNESMNIFVGPLLFLCWCVLAFFMNIVNIVISLVKNLNLLFSIDENKNHSLFRFLNFFNKNTDDEEKPPKWKKGSMFSSFTNIIIGFAYIYVLWLFSLFFGILIVYPIISMICIVYCFLLPMFMKAKNVKNVDRPTDYDFKNALLDVLKYKSQVIMLLIAAIIIGATYSYFGNVMTLISFVVFLIMFFFTPLFERYKLNIKDSLLPGAPVPVPPNDFDGDLIDEPVKPVTPETNVEPVSETNVEPESKTNVEKEEPVEQTLENKNVEEPPKTISKKSSYKHKWF